MTALPAARNYGEGREALLKAVVKIVATSGLRNLTYRSVAAEAGVAHGLVRHHFGSRDALIEEALRYSITNSIDTTSLEPESGQLHDLAKDLAEVVARNPEGEAFQFELLLEARRRPDLQHYIDIIYNTYRAATRRTLARAGLDDPDLADLVYVALDGLVFQQITTGEPAATRRGLAQLHKLLTLARAEGASGGGSNTTATKTARTPPAAGGTAFRRRRQSS